MKKADLIKQLCCLSSVCEVISEEGFDNLLIDEKDKRKLKRLLKNIERNIWKGINILMK